MKKESYLARIGSLTKTSSGAEATPRLTTERGLSELIASALIVDNRAAALQAAMSAEWLCRPCCNCRISVPKVWSLALHLMFFFSLHAQYHQSAPVLASVLS